MLAMLLIVTAELGPLDKSLEVLVSFSRKSLGVHNLHSPPTLQKYCYNYSFYLISRQELSSLLTYVNKKARTGTTKAKRWQNEINSTPALSESRV